MKKKLILFTLIGILSMTGTAFGEGEGIPLRLTLESMGYRVGWSSADKSVTAERDGESLFFKTGSNQVNKNGQIFEMSCEVKMIDGVAYLPYNAVDELGLTEKEGSLAYRINESFQENTNYVFSPFGFKSALAMLANGASGESRQEILKALGYSDIDGLNQAMGMLGKIYNTGTVSKEDTGFGAFVNSGNSLWVEKSSPQISSEFLSVMKEKYSASVVRVDSGEYSQRAEEWIREQSGGLQDITVALPENFAMSLINTLYLKADWQSKFEVEDTVPGIFKNADGSEGTVEYMNGYIPTKAYKDDRVTMVRLDYRDSVFRKDLSFYAAMADRHIQLEDYIDLMEYRDVILSLPKFQTESSVDMTEAAKTLGINSVFSEGADFSAAFEETISNVYVNSILQDTVIGVDEEGTQASSTTRVTLAGSLAEPEYIEVSFDRPFTYFIRDNDSGEILFMGRFAMAE